MSLRLGVACAVTDAAGSLLLSRRGDLNVWALPGGRLDAGERVADAAAREVLEETGVVAQVERAVGLYYLAGWRRMNVLYAAKATGGDLRQRTHETRENRFFPPDALPAMPLALMALDALAGTRHKPRTMETSPAELRRLRARFALRWVENRLRGRPEPAFPTFDIRAVGVIWDEAHARVLTLRGKRGRVLPRVVCGGEHAPWDELAGAVFTACGVTPAFRWVGLWQDAPRDRLEFVFAATVGEMDITDMGEWSSARNAALPDHYAAYVERVQPGYASAPVWTLEGEGDTLQAGDTIIIDD
jgi:ADP-ribose pyrophosphatase YjhB (NUDIX family)